MNPKNSLDQETKHEEKISNILDRLAAKKKEAFVEEGTFYLHVAKKRKASRMLLLLSDLAVSGVDI